MSDVMHKSAPLPFSSRINGRGAAEGAAEMDIAESPSFDGVRDSTIAFKNLKESMIDVSLTRSLALRWFCSLLQDCDREPDSLKLGAIFSFSEDAEESLREHASLILGEASRQSRDSYETVVCFPHGQ